MGRKFNRRTLFQLLAASSVGAMLPSLNSRSAEAQENDVPLRILFVELGHGARRGTWEPTVPGPVDPQATEVASEWSLRGPMLPLAPFKDRITLFQNLDMVSAANDSSQAANAHANGGTHMLVAADRFSGSGDLAGGQSIDQFIAEELNKNGLLTKLRSLEIGARENSSEYSTTFSDHRYAVAGEMLPFVQHIPDMWDLIFPDPLDTNVAAAQERIAKKTSVYNYVKGDYERLVKRLGVEDREKVQRMLDLRAELHESLVLINDRAANRPPQESILGPWSALQEGYQQGNLENRLWHTKVPLVGKMMGAALHTDTTRVGNLSIPLPPNYEFGYTPGSSFGGVVTSSWHDLTHKVSGDNPQLTDAAAVGFNDAMELDTYEMLAQFLAELDSLPETDGGSMLDHTLIVVHSHIGEGSHDLTRLPWLVIGDAHGALKTGQYVRFPVTHRNNANEVGALNYPDDILDRIYNYRGRPHNDLFVTLARAMGINIQSFGRDLDENRGVIEEMLA